MSFRPSSVNSACLTRSSLPPVLAPPSCGPVESGKQVISLLVRPNKATANFVNLESEEKFYTKGRHFCPEVREIPSTGRSRAQHIYI